jgi:hypothetical protein
MTVESMFSMNKAVATMSGIRRSLVIKIRKEGRERSGRRGCNTASPVRLLRNPAYQLDPA